ncbi:MAG: alpha/beta hydrolase [Ferrimonas sp.]
MTLNLIPELQYWYQQGSWFQWQQHKIFYGEHGAGESIILLHGFPTSSWDWQYLQPVLSQHFQVVHLDLLGFGFSDKPNQPYSIGAQAQLVMDLLATLGIQHCHIIAHDYGNLVAQELLAHHNRSQWRSCTLLNGVIFPELQQPLLSQRLWAGHCGSSLAWLFTRHLLKRLFSYGGGAHPPSDYELKGNLQLLQLQQGTQNLAQLSHYLTEMQDSQRVWFTALRDCEVALQMITGCDDPSCDASMLARYQTELPHRPLIPLDGVGHFPHLEAPHRVLQQLLPFLQRPCAA